MRPNQSAVAPILSIVENCCSSVARNPYTASTGASHPLSIADSIDSCVLDSRGLCAQEMAAAGMLRLQAPLSSSSLQRAGRALALAQRGLAGVAAAAEHEESEVLVSTSEGRADFHN